MKEPFYLFRKNEKKNERPEIGSMHLNFFFILEGQCL